MRYELIMLHPLVFKKMAMWNLQIFKEDEMGRTCSAHGNMRNTYKILTAEPEGKRSLEDLGVTGG